MERSWLGEGPSERGAADQKLRTLVLVSMAQSSANPLVNAPERIRMPLTKLLAGQRATCDVLAAESPPMASRGDTVRLRVESIAVQVRLSNRVSYPPAWTAIPVREKPGGHSRNWCSPVPA